MSRKKELEKIVGKDDELVVRLVDEIIFLENQLIEIKKLPFYKVNPSNKLQQKVLPVAKLYKETLQQYTLSLKLFESLTGQSVDDEESPLRKWVNSRLSTETELERIRSGKGIKHL